MSDVAKSKVVTHDFYTGFAKTGMNRDTLNTSSLQSTWNGKIGLATLADIFNASTTSYNVSDTNTTISNYLVSLSNNKNSCWTMTPANNNTFDMYAFIDGTITGKRRSSRYNQADSSTTYTMYIVPSFYVKSNVSYTGIGTKDNPFEI